MKKTTIAILLLSSISTFAQVNKDDLVNEIRPLTEKIPKPMLKVGDKPILETIILNFKKYHGI